MDKPLPATTATTATTAAAATRQELIERKRKKAKESERKRKKERKREMQGLVVALLNNRRGSMVELRAQVARLHVTLGRNELINYCQLLRYINRPL